VLRFNTVANFVLVMHAVITNRQRSLVRVDRNHRLDVRDQGIQVVLILVMTFVHDQNNNNGQQLVHSPHGQTPQICTAVYQLEKTTKRNLVVTTCLTLFLLVHHSISIHPKADGLKNKHNKGNKMHKKIVQSPNARGCVTATPTCHRGSTLPVRHR
jgi:hypothetical protein